MGWRGHSQELTPLEKCEAGWLKGAPGTVKVAYQAYDESFETKGGVLRWEDIGVNDEEGRNI